MRTTTVTLSIASLLLFFGCGGSDAGNGAEAPVATPPTSMVEEEVVIDPMTSKGVGPITSVDIDLSAPIDEEMAAHGAEVYEKLCTACHKADKKHIGPSPKGIFERRTPEWIMNMIMDPENMTTNDPTARALLIEFNGSPMANQNVSEEDTRAILEFFRTL